MATLTYRQALRDTLRAELLRDENVFLMGEEIGLFEGSYKITEGLLKEFGPKRVRDTPIAEEGFVGAAIGAAMLGLRPVVEIMTINFSLLALDQIVNHAAKIYGMFGGQASVPMVIRTPGGGGQQLGATHSQNVELFYSFIPGLKVVAPSTPAEASAMLKAAIRDDDPVLFLENLALYNSKGELPAPVEEIEPAEIGRAAVTRPGTDITIIGYSRMARVASEVAETLAAEGVSAEVVDLRSLRPLDRATIVESVRRTGCAVVAEDDWLTYGIGAEIAATIQEFVVRWHAPGKVDRAVRFMLTSGRPEFSGAVWPLITYENAQVSLKALRECKRFRPSILGSNAGTKIKTLSPHVRTVLLDEMVSRSSMDGLDLASAIAQDDPDPEVQASVVEALAFRRADRHVTQVLQLASDATFDLLARRDLIDEVDGRIHGHGHIG